MDSLNKLIEICEKYIKGDFNLIEFQKRIDTILLPDDCKNTLEIDQHNATNLLEKIRFSYFQAEQKKYADKVAENLINATILEKNRIKTI